MDLLTANDVIGEYPQSYYATRARPLPPFQAASGDMSCDVCVVGGGFTGLSSALHLAQRGYDVVLLEASRVGFGASGRNGGQVGMGQRQDQRALERLVGPEQARALWEISVQSVDLVRQLAKSPLVEAEFHSGIIHAAHRERFMPDYRAEADYLRTHYDHAQIRSIERDELRDMVASDAYHGGTIDTRAGHIDPLQLALGLARMAQKAGVRIFEKSRVTSLHGGSPAGLTTDLANISARHVILACNGYLNNLAPKVASRVMPINNYIAATAPMTPDQQERIIRNNVAVADSKFVVNYFRFSDDHRLLFGGTESYGYRFPRDIARNVRKPLGQIFPQLGDIELTHAWGGTLGITMNRMPHFERLDGNILSMSGYSGHGVAMATLAGQLGADAIAGQAERFDVMANVPTHPFPGGRWLRHPLLVLGMVYYALRDRI